MGEDVGREERVESRILRNTVWEGVIGSGGSDNSWKRRGWSEKEMIDVNIDVL